MKPIRLVDVYRDESMVTTVFLYELLAERDPISNISHRKMPSYYMHASFVDSRPYLEWFIIYAEDDPVGAVYLTHQNEIGIAIMKAHQGNCYGKQAVRLLMQIHPGKQFLANIAPSNTKSISMFETLGFDLCQYTFRSRTTC